MKENDPSDEVEQELNAEYMEDFRRADTRTKKEVLGVARGKGMDTSAP